MLAPVMQAKQGAGGDFNQVSAGIEPRVSPPKPGPLTTQPLRPISQKANKKFKINLIHKKSYLIDRLDNIYFLKFIGLRI